MKFAGTDPLKPNEAVIFTQLSDGMAVLLHLQSKLYYSLNGSGAFMWRLLESHEVKTPAELIDRVTHYYEIPQETAQSDVEEFLEDLLQENLLEKVRAP
jgi:hypothetical protein